MRWHVLMVSSGHVSPSLSVCLSDCLYMFVCVWACLRMSSLDSVFTLGLHPVSIISLKLNVINVLLVSLLPAYHSHSSCVGIHVMNDVVHLMMTYLMTSDGSPVPHYHRTQVHFINSVICSFKKDHDSYTQKLF